MKLKQTFILGFTTLGILGFIILGVLAKREDHNQRVLDEKQRALDDKYRADVNPTDGSADEPGIQRVNICSDELKAWVVDLKSNKIVAYREFPPPPLSQSFLIYDEPESLQIKNFTKWIHSIEQPRQEAN